MDNTTELDEFDAQGNEVRVFASIYKRRDKWTTPETVALRSGLSLAASTSALWDLKRQEVVEWKWQGRRGVFQLPKRGGNSNRASLEYEARRLRLIDGPRMKPLFLNDQE
jgi:hypothetical protein